MPNDGTISGGEIAIRRTPRAGDLDAIVEMHRRIYGPEYGFDATFGDYVGGPLSEFLRGATSRDGIWIAELDGRMVGCVAIACVNAREAQLRWYLVDPTVRRRGLGARLLNDAVAFCREQKYESVFLWTVSALVDAARLYRAVGFVRTETVPGLRWGVSVIEEKYELTLRDG